ncbi:SAM-dependent methyltransferase [Nostoc sp. CCY 9925]|uniref:SAM-dependent methyltransferase n=1 Tax=Nostoc sp. CCY 9925 TaxID=3103865 RepID=UPI0039C75BC1
MEIPAVPNTARIIDYWLGGSHHFEIDVESARVFEQVYPDSPQVFQTLRGYIGRVSRYIESQGINQFVVFGSGLPTCGNVHEAVPEALVLYTDIDRANIELGRRILANNSKTDYTFCDVTRLETLDRSVMVNVLGTVQRLGIVLIGVCAFIPDEILTVVLEKLYDWSPAGSMLALDFDGEAAAEYPQLLQLMDSLNAHLYLRNPSTIEPLLGRWQLTKPGILPVSLWQDEVGAQTVEASESVFMYGCVVYK